MASSAVASLLASASMTAGAHTLGRSRRTVGRPRDATAATKIIEATARLIGDLGYARVRIEDIAAEAGVSKSSLYRRWSSKGALVASVVEDLFARRGVIEPEGDDIWEDLQSLVRRLVWSLRDTSLGAALAGLVFERSHDPELREVFDRIWIQRRQRIIDVLRPGVERGQISPAADLGVLADLLAGVLYYRLLISNGELDDELATQVVDLVRRGAEPGSDGPTVNGRCGPA